jgi:hypothetical protein
MESGELKAFLTEVGVSQADFARLLGVTSRAVTLWMTEERAVPGPAAAYVRVFRLLPTNFRQIELNRLKSRGTGMRDGIFGITFQGQNGSGMGMLIFDAGKIYGTDSEGARYDGTYTYRENTATADIVLKVTFPPGITSVFGICNPYEWSIDVSTGFDPKQNSGALTVKTSLGKAIDAQFKYLRPLPDAA